jgi:low temperature requirement protein LtrA
MQIGRTLAALRLGAADQALRRIFQRICLWLAASGALWIVGGVVHGAARDLVWLAAVAVDNLGPLIGFRTPRSAGPAPRTAPSPAPTWRSAATSS